MPAAVGLLSTLVCFKLELAERKDVASFLEQSAVMRGPSHCSKKATQYLTYGRMTPGLRLNAAMASSSLG